jgi:hypothetical protein
MLLGNFFNELRLRHQLGHAAAFPCFESSCNYLARVCAEMKLSGPRFGR